MEKNKKYTLLFGFLILIISLIFAINTPAESYEISIYSSTPIGYWIGIILVLIISGIIIFKDCDRIELTLSILLASTVILSIISLPILRGYYYFGMYDSISHLGVANNILSGNVNLAESLYPTIHIVATFLTSLTNLSIRTTMMMNIPIFAGIFIISTIIVLRNIYQKFNKNLIIIGIFSSFLFLPINNIGLHFQPHPSSQAVLFSPILLYIFIKYNNESNYKFFLVHSLLFLGVLFTHPQVALSFILIITIFIIFERFYYKTKFISYRLPILFGLLFWMWVGYKFTFQRSLIQIFNRFYMGNLNVAAGVMQQGESLMLVGSNLIEIFIKMFFVTFLFAIFSILYLAKYKSQRLDKTNIDWIKYFMISITPIFLLFLVYIVSMSRPGQDFRYLGIIFMILTITGAYGFFNILKKMNLKKSRIYIIAFILIILLLSMPTYFSSPWIYKANPHVTEKLYTGHEATFDFFNNNLNVSSTRLQSERFHSIIKNMPLTSEIKSKFTNSPDHFNNQSLSTYYNTRTYLAITESEFILDTEVYNGFRFSKEDFNYLQESQFINHLYNNKDFNLYLTLVN